MTIYIYIYSCTNTNEDIFLQLVFVVFTPCLMFANLAQTVTLEDIISWYALPLFTHPTRSYNYLIKNKQYFSGGLCP